MNRNSEPPIASSQSPIMAFRFSRGAIASHVGPHAPYDLALALGAGDSLMALLVVGLNGYFGCGLNLSAVRMSQAPSTLASSIDKAAEVMAFGANSS
jgi:hypothetical protein